MGFFVATNFANNYEGYLFKLSEDGITLQDNGALVHCSRDEYNSMEIAPEANKLFKKDGNYYFLHNGCYLIKGRHVRMAWIMKSSCIYGTHSDGLAYGESKGSGIPVTWSMWPMGGAWLTSELFKHYECNLDKDFLKNTAYPILKEAALFLLDWMFEYNGAYVTCPSTSPENRFKTKEGGTSSIAMSSYWNGMRSLKKMNQGTVIFHICTDFSLQKYLRGMTN